MYSNEVWTGIEYQVASHLMMMGQLREGLEIVRTCRDRYDGRIRNPFDEYECGHWYARAMSSYALLQGLSGARYDAIDKTLYLQPAVKGDFQSFLSTATGYGTVGVHKGKPFLKVVAGTIPSSADFPFRPSPTPSGRQRGSSAPSFPGIDGATTVRQNRLGFSVERGPVRTKRWRPPL